MKRAIIVHCWDGTPNYCWYPSVKHALEAVGFAVEVPAFPHTELPTQADWVPHLAQAIGTPDEELVLIGHSVGCITIMRYLETLAPGQQIGGVMMVAGFTEALGFKELENFFTTPIDFAKIKAASKNGFVAIHSTNDPYVDVRFADIFKKELNAQAIIMPSMGHFSGPVDNEASCTDLPEVVTAVQTILKG